jgi:hypothetical protein
MREHEEDHVIVVRLFTILTELRRRRKTSGTQTVAMSSMGAFPRRGENPFTSKTEPVTEESVR